MDERVDEAAVEAVEGCVELEEGTEVYPSCCRGALEPQVGCGQGIGGVVTGGLDAVAAQ